ncbi:hypothetical protein DK26_19140 [Bosea sp. WAO]|nr:hypothetical protein DK26_19140 [Bosea sp. WAO]
MKEDFKDLAPGRQKRLLSTVPVAEFRRAFAVPARMGGEPLPNTQDGLLRATPGRPGERLFGQNAANEPFFLASPEWAKTFFGLVVLIKKNIRLT